MYCLISLWNRVLCAHLKLVNHIALSTFSIIGFSVCF
ncbi:hypothetical protein C5167_016240, partial [Papaver somniferum]